MKQITLFFFILLPFLGITQQDSSVFYTGRGNLKLSNGKFTITRPNGNLIAVFPNYLLKKQVDSLINNYNDTTDKSGISCVDSLWKVGNIVYHRNWNCDVQSFVIDPPTVDGCSGGRVYHKNILADTSFLTPSPVCGDILVIEGDTCKDLLYIKGNSPSKWNFIGGYLKNSNCFDPLPCKDSVWKVGLTVYYRNVDCFIYTFKDSIGENNDTLYSTLPSSTSYRVTHKPNGSSYFTLKAGTNIELSDGVIGKTGEVTINSKSSTADTLFTQTANSSTLKFTHKPAQTTDVTINAGTGINFTNASVGANNVHGTITINADPLPCKDSVWKVGLTVYYRNVDCFIYTFKDSIGENNDTLYSTLPSSTSYRVTHKPNGSSYFTLKAGTNIELSDGVIGKTGEVTINSKSSTADTLFTQTANSSTLKFTHKPAQTTDVTINAGTGINFTNASVGANNVHGTITINAVEGDGDPSNEIQVYEHTGTTSYTNTLSRGGGTFTIQAGSGIGISHSGGTTTISNTATPTVFTAAPIVGDGTAVNPVRIDECSVYWNGLPTYSAGTTGKFLFVTSLGCLGLKSCTCSGGSAMVEEENPAMYVNEKSTITTMQVARKVFEQQKIIDSQTELINSLIKRIENLEKR